MKFKDYEIKIKIRACIKEILETTAFVIVMVVLIRFFIGEIRWIPSGSMKPTLVEGDRIFVEKFSRFYSTPKRGDVMVFYPPMVDLSQEPMAIFKRLTGFFCKDIAYIKRVIGLPGDKILIQKDEEGKYSVFINDKKIEEEYIFDDYDYVQCVQGMYCGPMRVPENNYFLMGDNRGNSQDSRFWGFLSGDRFVGKAVFIFWPITRIKNL